MEKNISNKYIITFRKTSDTIAVFNDVNAQFNGVKLIPVPYQISNSCGLAVEFPRGLKNEYREYFYNLNTVSSLYIIDMVIDGDNYSIIKVTLEYEKL